ncbi:MAG: hypothetical protein D6814_09970 [Calditrichaeota bacterium]|nr:MAG: hypothetical protein D6814_09970 [Calditrichota bacterium]
MLLIQNLFAFSPRKTAPLDGDLHELHTHDKCCPPRSEVLQNLLKIVHAATKIQPMHQDGMP